MMNFHKAVNGCFKTLLRSISVVIAIIVILVLLDIICCRGGHFGFFVGHYPVCRDPYPDSLSNFTSEPPVDKRWKPPVYYFSSIYFQRPRPEMRMMKWLRSSDPLKLDAAAFYYCCQGGGRFNDNFKQNLLEARLIELLEHDDIKIREKAVSALMHRGEASRFTSAFVYKLYDAARSVRDSARRAIAFTGDTALVVNLLLAQIDSFPYRAGEKNPITALCGFKNPYVIDALTKTLYNHPSKVARECAAKVLVNCTWDDY